MCLEELSPPPGARRLADLAPERLAEMRLVGKAARESNLTELTGQLKHQLLSASEAQPYEISVGRDAE